MLYIISQSLSNTTIYIGRVWFHELVRGSSVYIEPKLEDEDPEVRERIY